METKIFDKSDFDYSEICYAEAEFQTKLEKGRNFPYVFLARLSAVFYISCFLFFGVIAYILNRHRKNKVVDDVLAEKYFYVPEAALYRRLEVMAALSVDLNGRCLEIGSGHGFVGSLLKEYSNISFVASLDFQPPSNTDLFGGLSSHVSGDHLALPFQDEKFDTVIALAFAEHIENLRGALQELSRVVKVGGAVIFSTPKPCFRRNTFRSILFNLFGFSRKIEKIFYQDDLKFRHHHYLTEQEWKNLLLGCGFKDLKFVPFFSDAQYSFFDLLNYGVWNPIIYPNEHTIRWFSKTSILKNMMIWAVSNLLGFYANWSVSKGSSTHHFIIARK